MKQSKKLLHQQRQLLDLKIHNLPQRISLKKGWIKSVRNALGITTRQLASLMKVSSNNVTQLEASEVSKSVSIKNLIRAAEAMECELVYMIIPKLPNKSFDELLEKKAFDLASKIAKGVSHSMELEEQGVDKQVTQVQIKNLALELKTELDPRLWTK